MPIEVNRVNKECAKCKNPTIFDTGKNYFCGKCLTETPKIKESKSEQVMVEIREEVPVKMYAELTEEDRLAIAEDSMDQFERNVGPKIKDETEYLAEKQKLEELTTTDFNLNPSTEQSLNIEINTMKLRISEYEARTK